MWASLSGLSDHGFSFTFFLQVATLKNKFRFGVDSVRWGMSPSSGWLHASVRRPEFVLALFTPASKLQHLWGVRVKYIAHAFGTICLPLGGELSGKWIYQGCEGSLHWTVFMGKVWPHAGPSVNLEHPEGTACMSETAPESAIFQSN